MIHFDADLVKSLASCFAALFVLINYFYKRRDSSNTKAAELQASNARLKKDLDSKTLSDLKEIVDLLLPVVTDQTKKIEAHTRLLDEARNSTTAVVNSQRLLGEMVVYLKDVTTQVKKYFDAHVEDRQQDRQIMQTLQTRILSIETEIKMIKGGQYVLVKTKKVNGGG